LEDPLQFDINNLIKPYLIGEIGINHNGSMPVTKKLIDAVHATGWHCAKFQKRNPDVCVPEHQKGVMRETPWGRMRYIDYKYKVEFEEKEYNCIDSYCSEKPIDWSASVWDLDSLEFLMNYDLPFIKIPSAMMTNTHLVREVAMSGRPVIMSTGMSTLEEVDGAVNNVMKYTDEFALMHTNSSYPTPVDELNLRLIPFFKSRYDCVVGYSGHEHDLMPTVLAVALGAQVVERHITISHDMWGTDQKSSLEIHAMSMLQKRLANIDRMMGSGIKKVTESEISIRKKLRG
jgi:N-acetylneuraminate synthase